MSPSLCTAFPLYSRAQEHSLDERNGMARARPILPARTDKVPRKHPAQDN